MPALENSPDADDQLSDLIARAVGGDMVALTTLLAETRSRLCRHVSWRIPPDLKSSVDAEDIVQEAHVEIYRHIGGFRVLGDDSFYRWMATIALRKLRDAVRMRRATKRAASPMQQQRNLEDSVFDLLDLVIGPGQTASRSVARGEAVAALRVAIDALPEDYREAVWLVHIQGLSVTTAAAQMGRTERAIHNLCYKARERMRELLGSGSRFLSDG